MTHVLGEFWAEFPHECWEVFQSLLPMLVVFLIAQFAVLKLRRRVVTRILVGLAYTFVGLVLFLVGINVGFMPAGSFLGQQIAQESVNWLIPVAFALGFVVVMAEPAVQVLNEQVVQVSGGSIHKNTMLYTLAIGVAFAVALAMVRIIYDFSIWWYLIPGYGISLLLMKVSPSVFTAIAFDSGGVASGPMTATFILAFAMGAAESLGGNVMANAFGTVAMVALTPLIAVQIMGVIFQIRTKDMEKEYDVLQVELDKIKLDDEIEFLDESLEEVAEVIAEVLEVEAESEEKGEFYE